MKLKPFDLAKALAGAPVVTRDGREVKILDHTLVTTAGREQLVVKVYNPVGQSIFEPNLDGSQLSSGRECPLDLFLKAEEKTCWLNFYSSGTVVKYKTLEDAQRAVDRATVELEAECVQVTYEV